MTNEKRLHPRKGFNTAENDFSFYLEDKGQQYQVNDVQNVSISGVGVGLSKGIKIGQKIALKYDSADYHLSINGTIVWCDNTLHTGLYRLGVEFDAGNQEDNALFFLAVRKYLDPFDSVATKAQ